jgi:hypothetical protein
MKLFHLAPQSVDQMKISTVLNRTTSLKKKVRGIENLEELKFRKNLWAQ